MHLLRPLPTTPRLPSSPSAHTTGTHVPRQPSPMLPLFLYLLAAQNIASARASPLIRRLDEEDPNADPDSGAGHLDTQWVIVIAVVFSVVVLGVIATVVWVRVRRQRRERGPVQIRSTSPYDCVRQSRHASPSVSERPKSSEGITAPLPVVYYDRHRSSSASPERSHR